MLDGSGIELINPADHDPRFAAWIQMARAIRTRPGCHVVALVPTTRRTGVVAVALQLGVALKHVSGKAVHVVDCNTTLPARASVASQDQQGPYYSVQVSPSLYLAGATTPTRSIDHEWWAPLRRGAMEGNNFVICDLTGLRDTAYLPDFWPMVDGVASVAIAGKTWEWRLTQVHRLFPASKDLGVLFVERRSALRRGR